MTNRLANFLTPTGAWYVAMILAAILLLFLAVANGAGFRFDPFDRTEKRADRAESAAAFARSDATARSIEAAGSRATVTAVEQTVTRARTASAVAIQHRQQAEEAPDASQALAPDRLGRLRAADRCLCALSPDQCAGYAPATDDAGNGDHDLCAAPPS